MRPKELDRSTDVAGDARCRSVRSSRLRRTDLDENPVDPATKELSPRSESSSGRGRRRIGCKIDSTTYTGRMFLHLLAALAEWERDRLAERTSEGMAYARESHPSNGGRCRRVQLE